LVFVKMRVIRARCGGFIAVIPAAQKMQKGRIGV
jgi:hypothetical protein